MAADTPGPPQFELRRIYWESGTDYEKDVGPRVDEPRNEHDRPAVTIPVRHLGGAATQATLASDFGELVRVMPYEEPLRRTG